MTDYISREAALKDFEASNAENPRWTPQRVKTLLQRRDGMSGLRFARGSLGGGKLMHDCCLTCKNLEYRKNYVFPYRCLKHKAERFSEQELERMCFSGEKCGDFEERRWPNGNDTGD